ncbi:hypothetical protein KAR91_53465 [Candidatus Pacearchaeota archaeon]|nr:hypothetical protein [Candidatus Pacearchaeota archaeon]
MRLLTQSELKKHCPHLTCEQWAYQNIYSDSSGWLRFDAIGEKLPLFNLVNKVKVHLCVPELKDVPLIGGKND